MKIELEVSDHPLRCIDEDGTRCKWLRTSRFGSVWSCKVFSEQGDNGRWESLKEIDGCLLRHSACVNAEVSDDKNE